MNIGQQMGIFENGKSLKESVIINIKIKIFIIVILLSYSFRTDRRN